MSLKHFISISIIFVFLFVCFSGCTDEPSTDTATNTESEYSVVLFDDAKVLVDLTKINISQLSVRTGARRYINPENTSAGLYISYVDGFNASVESDAGLFYHLHGKITNIAGDILDNITLCASFTNQAHGDITVNKTKEIRRLGEKFSFVFDFYLYEDDIESLEDVDYVVLTIHIDG